MTATALRAGLAGTLVTILGTGLAVGLQPQGRASADRPEPPAHTASAPASAGPTRHIVLVSGRDDHGDRQLARIALVSRPRRDAGAVTSLPDGTLVRVQQVRGTWVLVRRAGVSAGSEAPTGWVDDFRLRGIVHLVGRAPSCSASRDGRALPAGEQATVLAVRGDRARVRLVRRPEVTGWLPVDDARELPPSPDDPCPSH